MLMPKGFIASTRTFARNIRGHMARWIGREETAGEMARHISRDFRKLTRSGFHDEDRAANRKKARALAEKGREAYNGHDYERAINYFRNAVDADPEFARGFFYLGNAYYKQGQNRMAVAWWKRAAETDPDSEWAGRARQRLQAQDRRIKETTDTLEERLRGD
jgi:tetratricopeptide (TPR) repeat protein